MRGDLLILLADALAIVCLARFALHRAGIQPPYLPAAFCIQASDWLVRPLRKIVPPLRKWDTASVAAAFLLYYVAFTLMAWIALPDGFGTKIIAANFLFACLGVLKAAAYVLLIGLMVRMIASWRDPYSETAVRLHNLFVLLLRPFAFLKIGHYDFSGSALVLILWFWLSIILPLLNSRLNLWLLQ